MNWLVCRCLCKANLLQILIRYMYLIHLESYTAEFINSQNKYDGSGNLHTAMSMSLTKKE